MEVGCCSSGGGGGGAGDDVVVDGGECLKKRKAEDVDVVVGSDVPSFKFKRRRVSAVRDFPNGCGRFAPLVNNVGTRSKNVDVGGGAAEAVIAGSDSVVMQLRSLQDSRIIEKSEEQTGLPKLVKTPFSGTMKLLGLLEGSDRTDVVVEATEAGEPVAVVEISKGLNRGKEFVSQEKALEPHDMKFWKSLQPDAMDFSINASRPRQEGDISSDFLSLLPVDSHLHSTLLSTDILEQEQQVLDSLPKSSDPVPEAVQSALQKKYPIRRRISACRDFPPGCGRNAPPISRKECLEAVVHTKKTSLDNEIPSQDVWPKIRADLKEMKEKVQVGDALNSKSIVSAAKENSQSKLKRETKKDMIVDSHHVKETPGSKLKQKDQEENNMSLSEMKTPAISENVVKGDRETLESKLKQKGIKENNMSMSELKTPTIRKNVVKEVANFEGTIKVSKEKTLKRKFPNKSEDNKLALIRSPKEDSVALELFNDRVIVQALMAAPNCPWRNGKRSNRSPFGASQSSAKRKHKLQVVVQESEMPPPKKDKTVGSKGKVTKKVSPLRGSASQGVDELIHEDDISPSHEEEKEQFALVPRAKNRNLSLIPFGLHASNDSDDHGEGVVTRNKVRETLRLFQAIFRKFLQDEEAKSNIQGNNARRIDLNAVKVLKDNNKCVNTGEPILGNVPGVEVGDEFHYRVELSIIGLHRHYQNGIDYVRRGSIILATSVVASGGYDDEVESSDVMVYSGQGGHPTGADKKAGDQKLERGNLALKNSMDEGSPVRVIRGFKEAKGSDSSDAKGKIGMTYTYDGLYQVEKYWTEKGRHGNNVFKFQMRRIPGQPELALKEVKNSKKLRHRKGLCVDDISQGKEKMPISAVNTINDEKPPPFEYVTSMIYPSWYNLVPPKGCDCTNGCSDSVKCLCAVKNGGELPFNYNGAIVEAKPLVFECGPFCRCPPSCHNRVSQHGIKFQLEIFKTDSRGWGVRSLSSIPSGSFICEYTGELLEDKEADQRTGNDEYLFDIGQNYMDRALWDGLSTLIPPALQSSSSCETVQEVGFTIDAAQHGNVGRFINHSCSPNLYAQNVLYDHDDKRMPHIMFFAAENIPPLQELTYHYNYELDQVHDALGNIKKKDCYCGSLECTGRMY